MVLYNYILQQEYLQKPIWEYVIEGSKNFFFWPAANLPTQPLVQHSNAETPLCQSKLGLLGLDVEKGCFR